MKDSTLIGFIPTADADRARAFYADLLKLEFVGDDGFAVVFRSGANMLRIARVERVTPAPYTILGWEVPDLRATVQELAGAGIEFLRYGFLEQEPSGIWVTPSGSMVAWFADPDGNILSLSQHA